MNFTQFNNNSIYEHSLEEDAIDYLKNPDKFRAFDKGLIEILQKKDLANSNLSKTEISKSLYNKMRQIGSDITFDTVSSWVNGSRRPKIDSGSRKRIYELCFAIDLSLEETVWFFNHTYYDRAFNCHVLQEAVFYFSFKNGLKYQDALEIIDRIDKTQLEISEQNAPSNFTHFIQKSIDSINDSDELVHFLVHNINNSSNTFWNKSAYTELKHLIEQLLPNDEGKKEIERIKRTVKRKNSIDITKPNGNRNEWLNSHEEFGLVMQEFFYELNDIDSFELIEGKNIKSNTFLLDRIFDMNLENLYKDSSSTKPKIKLPYIVINNFPSKKIMSDLLSEEKIIKSNSYDSIRKLIILLFFYYFWCRIKIRNIQSSFETPHSDIFEDEINYILYNCGYENIFAGNPYDWLFLCSSQAKDPIHFFRQCINIIYDDSQDDFD